MWKNREKYRIIGEKWKLFTRVILKSISNIFIYLLLDQRGGVVYAPQGARFREKFIVMANDHIVYCIIMYKWSSNNWRAFNVYIITLT